MEVEIYGLFAYDSVNEFLMDPQKWHSASYAKRIEDLPVGGFAGQDGSFEVTLKITVPAESSEAKMAGVTP